MSVVSSFATLLTRAREGDFQHAWPVMESVLRHPPVTKEAVLALAELISLDPQHEGALELAELGYTTFSADPQVIIALSAGLLRIAELRPPDEPPFERGAAHLAAAMTAACFDTLASAQRTDPGVGGYLQLNLGDALRMMGPDHDAEALKAYQLALTIDDGNGAWWFHLGIFHKWRGRFAEGLEANQRARARLGDTKPVLWNLALCATALGRGELALEAFQALGLKGEVTKGGLPHVPGIPPALLRVATVGHETGRGDPLPAKVVSFELVWVAPLSPCHGVVQSTTARRASVDYGDVVLWDGAPVRVNEVEGRPVPVFPLLWILRPGAEERLRFVGMAKSEALVRELVQELERVARIFVFDQRRDPAGALLFYGKLIAESKAALPEVRSALETAVRSRSGITLSIPELYERLGDVPAAGKAHQAWGGIERAAERDGLLARPKP